MSLKSLNTKYSRENSCSLKTTATQPVFGAGNPHADIVFIGEAPGANEDKTGAPFVGRAGQILDEALAKAGIERKDVYITNIVKYRPPKNRAPKIDEKEACLPWLLAEIQHIKPKIIVLLGQHALSSFFPNMKISHVHGTILDDQALNNMKISPNIRFLACYHPAATIYNTKIKTDFEKDIQTLNSII